MNFFKLICIASIMLFSAGCASLDCKPNRGTTLPGTDTAIVGIYIDKSGYPQAIIDKVNVRPGQKIVFVGPEKFEILFKDQRSPIEKLEAASSNGIITIEIPRDIFERNQRSTNNVDLKELIYRYGIRYNGKVTDPSINITR